jgi:tripartite-type tricarboxylate transporter receptor subunit TctC
LEEIMKSITASTVVCAIALLCSGFTYAASTYPNSVIKLVVAFAPGGGTDVIARVLGKELNDAWNNPVVVENRPGAGSNIGTRVVARSAPDGYTVLATSTAFSINPTLYKNAGYNPTRDFVPIINAGASPTIVVVHPSVPIKNMKELIALSHKQPLSYASAGVGTVPFLTAEFLLNKKAAANIVHIPYAGAGPALTAVVAGHVPVASLALATPALANWISTGKLRAIAVMSPKRLASYPAVPTASESGFPGYVDSTWIGFLAPAKTPKEIIAKLNGEMSRILRLPAATEALGQLGFEWEANSPEQFASYIQAETAKWAEIVKATNTQVE